MELVVDTPAHSPVKNHITINIVKIFHKMMEENKDLKAKKRLQQNALVYLNLHLISLQSPYLELNPEDLCGLVK